MAGGFFTCFLILKAALFVKHGGYGCPSYERILSGTSGSFLSPGKANGHEYDDNENCRWKLIVPPGKTVQLTFPSFSTEKGFDRLYVYDGSEDQSLGKFSGELGSDTRMLFKPVSGVLRFRFTLDGSNTASGFNVTYELQDCPRRTWGPGCKNSCSVNCAATCGRSDGSCSCKIGFTGSRCTKVCPAGMYGQRCQSGCSAGCMDTCNSATGECQCRPGFKGQLCDKGCASGEWGADCVKRCPGNCNQTMPCDKTDGSCTCQSGYHGKKCSQECPMGMFGSGCYFKCSSGCRDTCNASTGECQCRPGFKGQFCDEEGASFFLITCALAGLSAVLLLLLVVFIIKSKRNKKSVPKSHPAQHDLDLAHGSVDPEADQEFYQNVAFDASPGSQDDGIHYENVDCNYTPNKRTAVRNPYLFK